MSVAKPTILKTRNLEGQLAPSIVPAEPPSSSVRGDVLTPYLNTQKDRGG